MDLTQLRFRQAEHRELLSFVRRTSELKRSWAAHRRGWARGRAVSLRCYGAVDVKGSLFVACYFVTIGSHGGVDSTFSKAPHLGGAKTDASTLP
jgi:hypothetical protein